MLADPDIHYARSLMLVPHDRNIVAVKARLQETAGRRITDALRYLSPRVRRTGAARHGTLCGTKKKPAEAGNPLDEEGEIRIRDR
nr:hypothetical protein [Burkholderia territorii]